MAGYSGDEVIISDVRSLMAGQGAVRSEAIRIVLEKAGHEPNRSNQRRIEMKMSRQDKMQNTDEAPALVFENNVFSPLPKDQQPDWYRNELWKDLSFNPDGAMLSKTLEVGNDPDMPRLTIWRRFGEEVYLVHYDDRGGSITEILIFGGLNLMLYEAAYVSGIIQMVEAEAKIQRRQDKEKQRQRLV